MAASAPATEACAEPVPVVVKKPALAVVNMCSKILMRRSAPSPVERFGIVPKFVAEGYAPIPANTDADALSTIGRIRLDKLTIVVTNTSKTPPVEETWPVGVWFMRKSDDIYINNEKSGIRTIAFDYRTPTTTRKVCDALLEKIGAAFEFVDLALSPTAGFLFHVPWNVNAGGSDSKARTSVPFYQMLGETQQMARKHNIELVLSVCKDPVIYNGGWRNETLVGLGVKGKARGEACEAIAAIKDGTGRLKVDGSDPTISFPTRGTRGG